MKLFSVEVNVVATAYVRADSIEEARALLTEDLDTGIHVRTSNEEGDDQVQINGYAFEDMDEDDDVTLSPAMTIQPLEDQDLSDVQWEEVHDFDDDGELK